MENANMTEMLISGISSVGFPMILSIYLLTNFSKSIESLTEQVTRLTQSIDRLESREAARHERL